MRRKILEDIIEGCLPIAVGFIVAVVFCLMITLCSCKPQQKIVEVERLTHDTTTVIDTVHIKDVGVQHDSIYLTQYITETVHDTTNVAWKYYTYDTAGNITSLLDYTSNTAKKAQKSTESKQKTVSDKSITHDEKSGHTESKGTTEVIKSKEQVKIGLTKWQKFIQILGYLMLVALVVGVGFGGLRLYGKFRNL